MTWVVHEADNAYSIGSTCLCYWLNQFLTLAFTTWISSKFSMFHWICLLFSLFCSFTGCSFVYSCNSCYYILECYNLFSGVKLSMRSFCFISCAHHSSLIVLRMALMSQIFAKKHRVSSSISKNKRFHVFHS